jgi:hypothetical protein
MDKEHPFGHGRAEYIAALIVAFSIFVMSFELAKSAVMKIIRPETVKYTPLYVALLLIAAGVKLWMAYFNKKLYAVKSMKMTEDTFLLLAEEKDDSIINNLQEMVEDMQKKLDYCRGVIERRTDFKLSQKKILLNVIRR